MIKTVKRTLAIGDIHGCNTALETLAAAVDFSREDHLVFLGDYIDRGPDSKGVIDFLLGLKDDGYDVVFLKGNHEIMMLEALVSRRNVLPWMGVGGAETMISYNASDLTAIPKSHWKFLENLVPFHETETHIFVHAGATHDVPMADQPDYMLYWEFFDFPVRHQSGKTVICGHSSQKNGRPLSVGHAICIDTFAHGDGGWLTCFDVDAEFCWQANKNGEVRQNPLEEIATHESHS